MRCETCSRASLYNCAICAHLADRSDVPVIRIDRQVKRGLVVLAIVVLLIMCLCVAP